MSFTILADVFAYVQSTPELKPAEVLTLLALANHQNSETGLCCPSVATLSQTTHLPRRSQQRALQSLRHRGLIVSTPDPVYRSSRYTLYVPARCPKATSARVAPQPAPRAPNPGRNQEEKKDARPQTALPRITDTLLDLGARIATAWRMGIRPSSVLWGLMTGLLSEGDAVLGVP